jgi:hypothetical protein
VAPRGDRFRQLRTSGTADLFEHFGVPAQDEPRAPEPASPAIAAAACEHCGWYRALPMAGACPLCGAPGREAPSPEPTREAGPAPRGEDGTTA